MVFTLFCVFYFKVCHQKTCLASRAFVHPLDPATQADYPDTVYVDKIFNSAFLLQLIVSGLMIIRGIFHLNFKGKRGAAKTISTIFVYLQWIGNFMIIV